MLVLDRHNRSTKLVDILARAEREVGEWHFVNIKILNGSKNKLDAAVTNLIQLFETHEGAIFKVSDYKILVVGRFGEIDNHGKFRRKIERKVYKLGCRVVTQAVCPDILSRIEVDYVLRDGRVDDTLYKNREARLKNQFLAIDDSQSILEALQNMLRNYGATEIMTDPGKAGDKYVEVNPDVVFLDINMPDKDGFKVLEELRELDSDAFIVMMSTDSHKGNILEAVSHGAVGFLGKPIRQDRMDFYINSCTTISSGLVQNKSRDATTDNEDHEKIGEKA